MEAVKQMGHFGLFGLSGPEEYGGAGDFTSLCIAIEEIGKVDQSLGITLEAAVGLGANPLAQFGTEEQKQRWLPDLLAGHALAAFGLTEPESGSDALAMRTRATAADDGWVINGSKQFITNSGTDITSLITVTARTGTRDNGKPEISTLIVPRGTDGSGGRAELQQTGLARLRHPSAESERRPRSARPSARRAGARAIRSSSPSSTTGGSRSPHWRSAASGPAGIFRSATRWSARRSADPSAASRRWRSRSPISM